VTGRAGALQVLILLPFLVAACTTATVASVPTKAPLPAVLVTVPPTPLPTAAPSTPTPVALDGNGIKDGPRFSASGDSVTVVYSFDCSAGSEGNFTADLVDVQGVLVDEVGNTGFAAAASGSTMVDLANTTSPYHVEVSVNSNCAWTVTVTGTP
jgi:hypothetical protein